MPKPPVDIDASQMTDAQLHAKLQRGYDDYKAGKTQNAMGQYNRITDAILWMKLKEYVYGSEKTIAEPDKC
ncbi:MAG: hypothetical protein MJ134_07880 [Lachnospiraceae bacterium]|nr:hypothetical protein [Lachnospiraceae bacterium]